MKQKISVIIKEPDKKPRHVYISNTLENLQKTVGGYIETVAHGFNFNPHEIPGLYERCTKEVWK